MTFIDTGDSGHDLAGSAVTALKSVTVDERLLQRMQPVVGREPLDRGHLAPFVLHGQRQAGQDPVSVDQLHAGTARPLIATLLRAVQLEMLTHEVQ